MEIGEKYIHKFNPAITCEIAAFTENGYRVQQTEGKKKPKQAFFYKADFDVKNGFWVKLPDNTPKLEEKNNELKYPTFEDFLNRISINNIEKKKDAEMYDVEILSSRYYFYSDFSLDGIQVKILWSKYNNGLCSITVSGLKTQKFSEENYDYVITKAMYWLYKNYFSYSSDEKGMFKVYQQGYLGFDFYKFPQYFDFVGTHAQTNYDDVVIRLNQMGFDMKTLFIEKVLYNYQNFKSQLLNLEL